MNRILIEIEKSLSDLALIPYENLSKVVAFHRAGDAQKAMDTPERMRQMSLRNRSGGTCFSLTYYLKKELDKKNIRCKFLMGDKYAEKNIHCGLLASLDDGDYLLDPGYMIYTPLPLPKMGMEIRVPLAPNTVYLEDRSSQNVWRLCTGESGKKKWRFDFRKTPVEEEAFERYWKETFFFDMMNYPVLNKLQDGVQYYLQKNTFITRSADGSVMEKLDREQFIAVTTGVYGLSEALVNTYLGVLDGSRGKNLFPQGNGVKN